MSQLLLDVIALAGAAVAVLVDRRWAVPVAAIAVALGLTPAAATYGGGWAAVAILVAAAAAAATGWLGWWLAARLGRQSGSDPRQPVAETREALFGPRSARVAAAAISLPAISWISFNIPIGAVTAVEGRLFPVAAVFTVGAIRLLLGRSLTDLSVGVAVVGLGVSVGWLLRGGLDPLPVAIGVAALAPAVSGLEAWLRGHRRAPIAGAPS